MTTTSVSNGLVKACMVNRNSYCGLKSSKITLKKIRDDVYNSHIKFYTIYISRSNKDGGFVRFRAVLHLRQILFHVRRLSMLNVFFSALMHDYSYAVLKFE